MLIGIDVGGTFTDLAVADAATGTTEITKVPSTPRDEARAVLKGLVELGAESARVSRIVHGTTVGTNAILQKRGALVATEGFRDLIEIGRTKRNIPALFNPTFVRPKPPVPRPLRFEVRERVLNDGSVLTPLDQSALALSHRPCFRRREGPHDSRSRGLGRERDWPRTAFNSATLLRSRSHVLNPQARYAP